MYNKIRKKCAKIVISAVKGRRNNFCDLQKFIMVTQSWADIITASFQNVWLDFASFLPNLVGALIVFAFGLLVASGLGFVVEKLFQVARLDAFLSRLGLNKYVERAGLNLRGAYFLGRLVYWFIVLAFLLAVSDILRLFALSDFLRSVLNYLPNVLVAVLIMLAAFVLANFVKKVVVVSVKGAKLYHSHFLGVLSWWTIVIFGLLTALNQLRIAPDVLNSLITGFVAMVALAGGLAFGLGGREYAAHLLGKLRERNDLE